MRPGDRTNAGRAATDVAWKVLEGRDGLTLASLSGSRFSAGQLILPFFDTRLRVDLEEKSVLLEGRPVDETMSVLALHYLAGCGKDAPSGALRPFYQAEGGDAYYEAFKHRVIDRVAVEFGQHPDSLIRAGGAVGGMDVDLGSAAIEIKVFPKVWITVIVWEGDEEVPPSANVLFDSLAFSVLSTEDLAVVGSLAIARLVKAKALLSSGR